MWASTREVICLVVVALVIVVFFGFCSNWKAFHYRTFQTDFIIQRLLINTHKFPNDTEHSNIPNHYRPLLMKARTQGLGLCFTFHEPFEILTRTSHLLLGALCSSLNYTAAENIPWVECYKSALKLTRICFVNQASVWAKLRDGRQETKVCVWWWMDREGRKGTHECVRPRLSSEDAKTHVNLKGDDL